MRSAWAFNHDVVQAFARHRIQSEGRTGAGESLDGHLSADELEVSGKAPWQGKQPLEDMAKIWKGRDWVPLDAALAELQFWQRRDYQHTLSASVARDDIIETADRLAKRMGGRFVVNDALSQSTAGEDRVR